MSDALARDIRNAPNLVGEATSDPAGFREAMKRFASGVTVVTTVDSDGTWKGFTASAFCSLSIRPPLVLVCQARSATSHDAFSGCQRFLVNILGREHQELARQFAHSGGDKFVGGSWVPGRLSGLPLLPDALAVVGAEVHARHDGGDHEILIGRVYSCRVRRGAPMLHFDSRFWDIADAGTQWA
jgi:flavin reductase ActVB